jgi:hypothetical protein
MSFSKNYISDTVTLGVIQKTIEQKNALIPGVTVKAELSGLVQANVAEYYFNLAPAVGEALAGDDFNTANVGSRKAVMPLTNALQIDEKIPNVAIDTTSANLLQDVLGKAALAISNRMGAKFIESLVQLSQDATVAGANIYDRIVEAQAVFGQLDSTRVGAGANTDYSNADNGIQATTIIVGDAGRAELFKTEQFQRLINATGVMPRLIGEMLGMNVVYAQDLTTHEFIMLYTEGVAFPFSINTLRTVESELFNGVRVQAEVAFAEQAAPIGPAPGVWNFAILPIDSHAIKVALPVTTTTTTSA